MSAVALTSLKNYRLLGQSGLRVSPICLGCMTFGESFMGMKVGANKEESKAVFDRYVELGGNFFDTANTYNDGESEKYLGEFIKGRRDQFVIATKYSNCIRQGDPNAGGNHRKSLMQSLQRSLTSLQTDYIDLLYIHYWDFTTPGEEILRSFDDVVSRGLVHYIAVSDVPAFKVAELNTIARLRGWTKFIGLQIAYSLLERTPEFDLFSMAQDFHMSVLPWSPLAGGVLTGKYHGLAEDDASSGRKMFNATKNYAKAKEVVEEVVNISKEVGRTPAQVALNWVIQKEPVTSTIIGARTVKQLDDNLESLSFTLTKEQIERLDKVSQPSIPFPYNFLVRSPLTAKITFGGENVEQRKWGNF